MSEASSFQAQAAQLAGQAAHPVPGAVDDPLTDAMVIARGAVEAGLGLKLLGGLAVRVVCPDYPPRLRRDQDIDFACLSKERKTVAAHLERVGCQGDRRFNNLNGDRQMYFTAPSGRPIDVMVDRLTMCHMLDFRPSFGRLPLTVDVVDLLLSKLQIVELNEKDARDIIQLLSCMPIGPASGGLGIDSDRFCQVVAADWGWWRTVTGSLDKLPGLLDQHPHLAQPGMPFDPLEQAARLRHLAEETPKGMKWRMRASVGDKVRWYELPEEVGH
ncbi:MAG TPA: hypothetical protein VN840_15365 [Streptosporangiaceae bacterium]|nr:hypothetical protein [Streptosporangiaceae bacterium]